MTRQRSFVRFLVIGMLMACAQVWAVVNPFLQPVNLADLYRNVMILKVTGIDAKSKTVTVAIERVTKGAFAPAKVSIRAGDEAEEALFNLGTNQTVVAFVGKRKREDELLCYAGGGVWFLGKMPNTAKPSEWEWTALGAANDFYGIFNGGVDRLAEMMKDLADGRAYFPAKPYCRFQPARELGRFDQPVRGVALADLDGDGKLDAVGVSSAGVRVWLQKDNMAFQDVTEQLGLNGVKASSVAVAKADVDPDGPPDLLLDGTLWLRTGARYVRSERVPPIPGLISATFAELDGDGWPDVLAATTNGVRVFLNPAKPGAKFVDATTRLGLGRPECGAGEAALVTAISDWNGSGMRALFLGTQRGLLLLQGKDQVFHPLKIPALELKSTEEGQRTGGAACGALWRPDAFSLMVPRHAGFALLVSRQEDILDYVGACNETSEPAARQLWTLAEDLNADGEVDIYTASGMRDIADVCHLNRGYGSYMRPMKYDAEVFPKAGYETGSWGLAAGDVDGDGTVDLLLGGCDGVVRLLINDSLALRRNLDESAGIFLRKLAKAKIIEVALAGSRGRIGATLTLEDEHGQVAAVRGLDGHGVAGSFSSGPIAIAVREAGNYTLKVRRSDGSTTSMPVAIGPAGQVVRRIEVK